MSYYFQLEMEEIRSSQTQLASSAVSAASESSKGIVLAPTIINERVIANQFLGVRRGHRKGFGRIIKGKRKAPDTSCLIVATGLSEQSS